jgi:hypothetical protein
MLIEPLRETLSIHFEEEDERAHGPRIDGYPVRPGLFANLHSRLFLVQMRNPVCPGTVSRSPPQDGFFRGSLASPPDRLTGPAKSIEESGIEGQGWHRYPPTR